MKRLQSRVASLADGLRTRLVNRFHRIVDIETTRTIKDSQNRFDPILTKGQIVKVKFVGTGAVIDGPHFAIVWSAFPKSDHIVVLPMTSQPSSPEYDLGPIEGLHSSVNVVKPTQPQSVSRKGIEAWYKKDGDGNNVPVKLRAHQIVQADDLFRKSILQEPLLFSVLQNEIGLLLPRVSADILTNLYRPVTFVVSGNQLWYKLSNDSQMRSIDLYPVDTSVSNRKRLLRMLVSDNSADRVKADEEITKLVAAKTIPETIQQAAPGGSSE